MPLHRFSSVAFGDGIVGAPPSLEVIVLGPVGKGDEEIVVGLVVSLNIFMKMA